MNTRKLKPKAQREMLADLCKQISELSDDYMTEEFVESALADLVSNLEEASQEDHFGTEGWEHFFGYED